LYCKRLHDALAVAESVTKVRDAGLAALTGSIMFVLSRLPLKMLVS
jgi:hypothetical protein